MILVTLAVTSAAAVWWRMSRPESSSRRNVAEISWTPTGPGSSRDADGDLFVLPPSDEPAPRVDRPPPAVSLARLALTVAATTALLVAVAWLIGIAVKAQLDSYFTGS